MGSSIRSIECTNCGGHGVVDDDYKEGILITDCEFCNYRKVEHYDVKWYETEKEAFSPPLTLISETK